VDEILTCDYLNVTYSAVRFCAEPLAVVYEPKPGPWIFPFFVTMLLYVISRGSTRELVAPCLTTIVMSYLPRKHEGVGGSMPNHNCYVI